MSVIIKGYFHSSERLRQLNVLISMLFQTSAATDLCCKPLQFLILEIYCQDYKSKKSNNCYRFISFTITLIHVLVRCYSTVRRGEKWKQLNWNLTSVEKISRLPQRDASRLVSWVVFAQVIGNLRHVTRSDSASGRKSMLKILVMLTANCTYAYVSRTDQLAAVWFPL